MRREHVRAEVTRQNQAAFPFSQRGVQVLAPSNFENLLHLFVRCPIEQEVSGTPQDMIPGEFATRFLDVPGAIQDAPSLCNRLVERPFQPGLEPIFQPAKSGEEPCRRSEREESKEW